MPRCFICSTIASPLSRIILPRFTPASFADENGNVLEPMKASSGRRELEIPRTAGGQQFSAAVYRINRPISSQEEPAIRTARLVKLSLKGLERAVAICRIARPLQAAYTYTDIRYKKVARKSGESARFMLTETGQRTAISYDVKSGLLEGTTLGSGIRYVNGVTGDRLNTRTACRLYTGRHGGWVWGRQRGLNGRRQLNVNNLTDSAMSRTSNSLSYCCFGAGVAL